MSTAAQTPATSAHEIYDEMSSFASYAFNKSHAACYAYVAFQTAYLKCHYPSEFMAALLTSVLDNTGKVIEYSGECARLGIKVLPPVRFLQTDAWYRAEPPHCGKPHQGRCL